LKTVLFAAAEAAPFAKTGGLGEVIGSLPRELRQQGVDARVILPRYGDIAEGFQQDMQAVAELKVQVGWRNQSCKITYLEFDGVPFYFVDNDYYFGRSGVYGHNDDGERFSFFCRSVLEALPKINFKPELIHCYDWHTAMICALLRTHYQSNSFYARIRTLFTIHNLKYQGVFAKERLQDWLGLDWEYFTPDSLEFYGQVNYMKGGLIYSDAISTVSPTYAGEIQQAFFGENLEGVLQQRSSDLIGITHGIDDKSYNPASDTVLPVNYDYHTWQKKRQNKEKLQEELGMTVAGEQLMVAMVTRMDGHKGLDLVACVLYELLTLDVQVVILGTGEKQYEHMFQIAAWLYPDKIAVRIGFDEVLARRIYSAADLLLMPSLYEPCGLSQMIAMRYGCLPVVRETGGLKEIVIPYNQYTGEGNGFSFTNYNAHDMLFTIRQAVELYQQDQETWGKLVVNAMTADNSLDDTVSRYIELYQHLAPEGGRLWI